MLATEGIFGLVAERADEIVGSGFQDERGTIVGVGPISVDPAAMDVGVGRALMEGSSSDHESVPSKGCGWCRRRITIGRCRCTQNWVRGA